MGTSFRTRIGTGRSDGLVRRSQLKVDKATRHAKIVHQVGSTGISSDQACKRKNSRSVGVTSGKGKRHVDTAVNHKAFPPRYDIAANLIP